MNVGKAAHERGPETLLELVEPRLIRVTGDDLSDVQRLRLSSGTMLGSSSGFINGLAAATSGSAGFAGLTFREVVDSGRDGCVDICFSKLLRRDGLEVDHQGRWCQSFSQ